MVEKLENEQEYWERYKEEGDMTARDDLIVQYSPLVKYVVGKMNKNMPPNVEFEDLVGYGTLGLIDAVEKFDHTRGIKFKTYAIPRIRGSILDELRSQDWVPRSVRRKARKIEKAITRLENRHGRSVSEQEVAEHMGISVGELKDTLSEVSGTNFLSLDEMWNVEDDDDEVPLHNVIEDDPENRPEQIVEEEEIKQILADEIRDLPEQERTVISLYYYEDLTLREIGEVLDVTESRVSQIHSKATSTLRSRLSKFEGLTADVLN